MALPPWLQITPSQYLAAVEAGTRAGLSIRAANQAAWENAQRMQFQAEQAQRTDLANRLQQERLDQYRQQELANARSRIGVSEQGIGLRQQALENAQSRFEESQKMSKEREADRETQREFRNRMSEEMLRLRQEGLDRSRGVPHFVTRGEDTFVIQPGSTNAVPVSFPKPPEEPSNGGVLNSLFSGIGKLGSAISTGLGGSPSGVGKVPELPTNLPQTKLSNPYKVGAQYGKLRYKGGDPNDESNWEPVQ